MTAHGSELTSDEAKAVAALQRLAKRWPSTLKLLSMSGTLCVVHTDDERLHQLDCSSARSDAVLAYIDGITNDGGDW